MLADSYLLALTHHELVRGLHRIYFACSCAAEILFLKALTSEITMLPHILLMSVCCLGALLSKFGLVHLEIFLLWLHPCILLTLDGYAMVVLRSSPYKGRRSYGAILSQAHSRF
jgi:hypothetical protein